jgi:hypothetical protein
MPRNKKAPLTKEQKASLIEYMRKHYGEDYQAERRFEPSESWKRDHRKGGGRKRHFEDGRVLTKKEVYSLVLYLYRYGYDIMWISKVTKINYNAVHIIIEEYEKEINKHREDNG